MGRQPLGAPDILQDYTEHIFNIESERNGLILSLKLNFDINRIETSDSKDLSRKVQACVKLVTKIYG